MRPIRPQQPYTPLNVQYRPRRGFSIIKLIVLGIAAWLGYIFYLRASAVVNVVEHTPIIPGLMQTSPGPQSQIPPSQGYNTQQNPFSFNNNNGAFGQIGGLGAVGIQQPYYADQGFDTSPDMPASNEDVLNLIQAAAKGENKEVKELLAKGVKINGRDDQRRTALIYASWNGLNDTCALLLSAGAQVHFQDRNGFNALDYAAGRGLVDTVSFLLAQAKVKDNRHYTQYASIIHAVYANAPLRLPEGKLPTINRINPEGQSPLHIAANSGLTDMAAELLKRGANVDTVNGDQQTPLHWAAWNNQTAAMELLLSKGANLNKVDRAGRTPLMFAVQHNKKEATQWLLAKKADKQLRNKAGETALMIAQEKNYPALITLLKQ